MRFYFIVNLLFSFTYFVISVKVPAKLIAKGKAFGPTNDKGGSIDAIIYEKNKQSGQSVSYRQSTTAFYDLKPIVDSFSEKQIKLICVSGSWLLYTLPSLSATAITEIKLLSADDKCVSPTITIGSIQPIGTMSPLFTDAITFFKQEFFSGEAVSVKETIPTEKFKHLVSQVDSLIVTGHSKWTIVVDFSQTICITVKTAKPSPICFVPYFEDKPFSRIFETRKGCDNSDNTQYNGHITLEECSNYGSGILENIDLKAPPQIVKTSLGFIKPQGRGLSEYLAFTSKMQGRSLGRGILGRSAAEEEKPPVDECDRSPSAEEEKMCLEMLNIRMKEARNIVANDINLNLPTAQENVWKTELLDNTIGIVLDSCPFEVVVPEYVKILTEMFVYHLNAAWTASPETAKSTIDEETWRRVVVGTRLCNEFVEKYQKRFQEEVLMTYTMTKSPSTITVPGIPKLKLEREKDTVIEFIWLAANYVAATCHHTNEYVDDFMDKYTFVFHQMYLLPLLKQWRTPGNNLLRCYNHILGGYDMDNQYQRMRICAEKSFTLTNNLEPWDKTWMNETAWARK